MAAGRCIEAGPAPADCAERAAGVARTAARAERQRLARDLHDSVTQTLIGLQLSAQAALDCWESQPERARAAVETIQRLARGACVEMRALLVDLRDDTLRRDGLAGALAQHAALIRRQSGLQVELRVGAAGAEAGARLPAAHEEALYRLAQEALANVVKHARATRATVTLARGRRCACRSRTMASASARPRRPSPTGWPGCASAWRRWAADCSWRPGPAAGRGWWPNSRSRPPPQGQQMPAPGAHRRREP
ncbi:MAG TPA: histidine kinase [Chloroflexota bacterium]|nr:histidine kinase [Chloroflexota bacterium]